MNDSTPGFLADGGEMGAAMRAHDWSRTSLGDPGLWSASLASIVGMVLSTRFPMFILWGPQYAFLYNDSYIPLLGKRHGSALGRSFADNWPEVWDEFGAVVKRAYAGESSFFDSIPIGVERNGFPETAWFTFSWSPLRDDAGALAGAICVCTETTRQVEEKQALHRSEARWRGLFGNMQEGFCVCEAVRGDAGQMIDFRFIELNPAFEKQTGISVADAAGMRATEAIPGLQHELIALYARVVDSGEPAKFEVHIPALEDRWYEAHARKTSDERFAVLFLDITARKLADAALRRSEQRFRTFAQALPDQMWAADARGHLDWFNDRVLEYSGMPMDELVGNGWASIVHPDDMAATLRAWQHSLASGAPYEAMFRLRRADGHYRWFRTRGLPIPDDSGLGKLWLGTNTDVQDQHDANEALQRMNETLELRVAERTAELEAAHGALRQSQKLEAVGKLTGGVAHDFNNVLQVISGNLQLLQPLVEGSTDGRRRLDGAIAGVERGAKLSSQLLAFARKQPLEPVVTDAGRLVREQGDLLRRTLGENVQLETVIAGGLWNALIDRHQLENTLLNLAINARDAMDGEGKLTIAAANATVEAGNARAHMDARPGQYVSIAVSDTGSGMSAEVVQQAFEPFFTTKPEGHGTGLGLSMVYGFVTQSGGHIAIESEVGHGTTITMLLPRSQVAEEEAAPFQMDDTVGGSETILVVEDDDQVRAIVVELLADLGYRVLKASDPHSALSIIDSGIRVDLLFTDVVMPGELRSPELARRARLAQPSIEVLFTSGYTENGIVHGGRLERGVALLSKPYTREALARKIRHVFANRAHLVALQAAAAPAPQARPLSILLAEDNADMREMTIDVLTALGHDAAGVGSGEDALGKLQAGAAYDVLITDVGLPGMSGHQLAEQARAMGMKSVIFASGYAPGGELPRGDSWLQKPFSLESMQAALEKVIRPDRAG